jgi:succinyl-diaminopimelate desuccinylase
MSTEQLIENTKELVAIPSTAQDPAALHQALGFVASMIWEARPDVTIERFISNDKPSLLAYREGQRPANFDLILNGHLDVVPGNPEQFTAVEKDGRLYGRGVYDMKAACVALTNVFCEYVNKVPYPLGLQIVTDEESAGKDGTLYQIQQGVRSDFVICGESGRSTNTYEIANEAKGIVLARIAFGGVAAHSAYPWKGDNAALKAVQFIQRLHDCYPTPEEETDQTVAGVTAIISDSGAHSKVPDHATVTFIARNAVGDANFVDEQTFINFIKTLAPEAQITEISEFGMPIYSNPRNPKLQALKAAAERTEGKPFKLVQRHGTGDGRFYANIGSEACEFGIAGEHAHGDGEYITIEAFDNYLTTMRNFFDTSIRGSADDRADP